MTSNSRLSLFRRTS